MAQRRCEPNSDATTADYSPVFVDTSLDTHLAMLVSNSDRVSDFKKKIEMEHMHCFPKYAEIRIQSLKVKRRANFYHLPDIMPVWSAFHGVKGNWFLSADASATAACSLNQNSSELGTSNGLKISGADVCRGLSSDVNRKGTLPVALPDRARGTAACHLNQNSSELGMSNYLKISGANALSSDVNSADTLAMALLDGVHEKNKVSEVSVGVNFECSVKRATDSQSNTYLEENGIKTDSRANKKHKVKHTEDICQNPPLRDSCTLLDASGLRNDQSNVEDRVPSEGTTPATAKKNNLGSFVSAENMVYSDNRKGDALLVDIIPEISMASKPEHELDQEVPPENSRSVLNKVPDLSARLMDTGGAMEDFDLNGKKRKKRKAPKTATEIQDMTHKEQTREGETPKPYTETNKSESKEEDKSLSIDHDHEVPLPSNVKALDGSNPDLAQKECSLTQLWDSCAVMESEISSGCKMRKKKKKVKKCEKSSNTNFEKSGPEQPDSGISGSSDLLYSSTNHTPEEADKGANILHHKGQNVQVKLLDGSTKDDSEKVQSAKGNEADFASGKEVVEKKTQSSADNCHADFPAVENGNQIVEFSQADKNSENTENKDKKSKKKRKKKKLTATDIQEDIPFKNQKVGIEELTTEENSNNFASSEKEDRHVALSQVLSGRSEEKLEEMPGTAIDTGDLARASKNEGETIKFNQDFLPGQYQDKVDSHNEVKRTTKSNEKKTRKKAKENELPYLNTSTELQNSLKSFGNKESEHISHSRKASERRPVDSAKNSDWDEVAPASFKASSRVSADEVNDYSPSEIWDMKTLHKPNENFAASFFKKEKRTSSKISSPKRSETSENRGKKKLQSCLNVTERMVTKTSQKKSLLTKSGAIFQDNSGEISGDENEAIHLDGGTRSPSDGSSLSGYSENDSDLSQDSSRNGSNDAKDQSTGGKSMPQLDLSASNDMTMDMILRSSKRFKKAKLVASQNDLEQNRSQQIEEFVPDSLPL